MNIFRYNDKQIQAQDKNLHGFVFVNSIHRLVMTARQNSSTSIKHGEIATINGDACVHFGGDGHLENVNVCYRENHEPLIFRWQLLPPKLRRLLYEQYARIPG
jgi:hypothetical protein